MYNSVAIMQEHVLCCRLVVEPVWLRTRHAKATADQSHVLLSFTNRVRHMRADRKHNELRYALLDDQPKMLLLHL